MTNNSICEECKIHEVAQQIIWIRTYTHYFDSEYDQVIEEIKKRGYSVTINPNYFGSASGRNEEAVIIVNPKTKDKVIICKHECGPEIIWELAKQVGTSVLAELIIKVFEKALRKKAKKNKEKIKYVILSKNKKLKIVKRKT